MSDELEETYECDGCGEAIEDGQAKYTDKLYGDYLCEDCAAERLSDHAIDCGCEGCHDARDDEAEKDFELGGEQ